MATTNTAVVKANRDQRLTVSNFSQSKFSPGLAPYPGFDWNGERRLAYYCRTDCISCCRSISANYRDICIPFTRVQTYTRGQWTWFSGRERFCKNQSGKCNKRNTAPAVLFYVPAKTNIDGERTLCGVPDNSRKPQSIARLVCVCLLGTSLKTWMGRIAFLRELFPVKLTTWTLSPQELRLNWGNYVREFHRMHSHGSVHYDWLRLLLRICCCWGCGYFLDFSPPSSFSLVLFLLFVLCPAIVRTLVLALRVWNVAKLSLPSHLGEKRYERNRNDKTESLPYIQGLLGCT